MASNSKIAESFKDGVGEVVEKAREVVNDGLDSAKDNFADRVDRLDRRYRKTVAQVRGSAERLSDNVHEHLDDARESLMEHYAQAEKRMSRLSRDVRRYVRDNPGKSLLTATALGFLAGLVAGLSRRKR